MKKILLATLALAPLLSAASDGTKRLNAAADVFSEVMSAPDTGIPAELLKNSHCIPIVPALKTAAFVFGGKYGKGYLTCRSKNNTGWSAPGTVRIEGGSFGFQIGGSEMAQTDAQLHAEILSWSRTQGLFAGVAVETTSTR